MTTEIIDQTGDTETPQLIECPLCGTEKPTREIKERLEDYGIAEEHAEDVNGNLRTVIAIGAKIYTSYETSAEDRLNTEKLMEILEERLKDEQEKRQEERKKLDEKWEKLENREERLQKKEEELQKREKSKIPENVKQELEKIGGGFDENFANLEKKLDRTIYQPKSKGTKSELGAVERLRKLNTGDPIDPKGGRKEEDIRVTLKDKTSGKKMGRVLIDFKDVKKWNSNWIDKMKDYIKDARADIGIIVTTAMPKGSLGSNFDYWHFKEKDNVVVVHSSTLEAVFLVVRWAVISTHKLENEYERQISILEQRGEIMEKTKEVLEGTKITRHLKDAISKKEENEELLEKWKKYNEDMFEDLRTNNDEIESLIEGAISEYERLKGAIENSETSNS